MHYIHQNYPFQFTWEHNFCTTWWLFSTKVYEQPSGIFLAQPVSSHLVKKYRGICVWFAKPLLDDTWLLYVQRWQFYGSWTSVKLQQDCLANLGQLTSFVKAYLIIFLSCIENNFHFIWFVIIENRMMWRRGEIPSSSADLINFFLW